MAKPEWGTKAYLSPNAGSGSTTSARKIGYLHRMWRDLDARAGAQVQAADSDSRKKRRRMSEADADLGGDERR